MLDSVPGTWFTLALGGNEMKLLVRLLQKRRGWAGLTLALSLFSITATLCWNARLSEIINAVGASRGVPGGLVGWAAVLILLCGGAAYALNLCVSWTVETLAHDLRMGYAVYFTRLTYPEIEHQSAGEQISRLQNEMDEVSVFLRGNLFGLIDDLIRFAATFGWMLWLNPSLTLLFSIPVVVLIGYSAVASRLIGQTARVSQQANMEMTGFADTLLAVFPVLRIFGAAALLNRQYGQRLENWEAATRREERRKALLMTLSGMLSSIPLLLLCLIGGIQVIQGTTDLGTLYIFLNLSGNVSGVMMNMAGRAAEFRRFAANMDRLSPQIVIEGKGARA